MGKLLLLMYIPYYTGKKEKSKEEKEKNFRPMHP